MWWMSLGALRLKTSSVDLERGTGVQIAVVTVPSLDGEPIEEFSVDSLARKWGVGQKGSNEGLMVLFAIQDRKMRIEVGYGLGPILTDGVVGSVQRSLREELRAGKYGDAILKCVRSSRCSYRTRERHRWRQECACGRTRQTRGSASSRHPHLGDTAWTLPDILCAASLVWRRRPWIRSQVRRWWAVYWRRRLGRWRLRWIIRRRRR